MTQESSGEKTEDPTPQKLKKAREKGQVAKSRDAVSALVFLAALATLAMSLNYIGIGFQSLFIETFSQVSHQDLSAHINLTIQKNFETWLALSLPILATVFLFGVVGNFAQIGPLFTVKPLGPDFKRINPVSGLKQMFTKDRLVELIKQIIKFTLVSIIVYGAIKMSLRDVVLTQRMELWASALVAKQAITTLALKVACLFVLIAIADLMWQRHSFKKKMMMTKYEVKQEYKQDEGDPELKGERKRVAQEMLQNAGQARVAQADAVITNPAHLAIAIKYSEGKEAAPIVIAKGMRKNAEKLIEIAQQNNIFIMRNVPLAHALHKIDLETEIPPELYDAVAEVLNLVYELKGE